MKIDFMYYVKLNHDAMIVISKNKERKNVENCSRQKYRKFETFFGRKEKRQIDNPYQAQNQYNSMELSFIQTINITFIQTRNIYETCELISIFQRIK